MNIFIEGLIKEIISGINLRFQNSEYLLGKENEKMLKDTLYKEFLTDSRVVKDGWINDDWIKKHIDSLELDKKLRTKMLLQIHDELIFECLEKDEEHVKKTVKEAMASISKSEHHMFSIPLEVNVNSGNNWGEVY